MKEQIQKLIADGRTEDALALLVSSNNDALLLEAQFNNGKKQYNMGLIDFSEWQRIQARVNYAALEMTNQIRTGNNAPIMANAKEQVNETNNKAGKNVFISYSQKDLTTAERVVQHLRTNGLNPMIDNDVLKPGENIEEFIIRALKEYNTVLFLVSSNSLISGWVGLEIISSNYANKLLGTRILPVALDKKWLNPANVTNLLVKLDKKIKALRQEREKRSKLGVSSTDIDGPLKRLEYHFQNLPEFCSELNGVLTLDISKDFDKNLDRIVDAIQSA